jgi:hypothetical protein
LVLTLCGLRSATTVDPFEEIRAHHGDFLRGTARFYMAMARPDWTLERLGDMNQFKPLLRDQHRFVLEALATGLRQDGGDLQVPAMLEHFSDGVHAAYGWRDTHRNFAWGMLLFADPQARRDAAAYAAQPLVQVFGRGTLDLVIVRHGWNEDGTMLTFTAGDHFLDHQHFDKGAFTLYHHGALAIDSGAYDRMYSAHHCQYATRTIAHNAPLVFDPQQPVLPEYKRDGGQRVLRGFQHHARWSDYLAHRAVEHLNAADLVRCEGGRARSLTVAADAGTEAAPFSAYAVAQAELAGAYGPAVRSLRRTLAYWPAAQVVVVDDGFELNAPLEVAFTLHTQDPPRPAAASADTSREAGIASLGSVDWWVTTRRGSLDLGAQEIPYDGRLFLRTLAPAQHSDRRIGGKGFQWWVQGTNYGPAGNGAPPRESGGWRVEVSPSTPAASQHLTHALFVADASAAKMPEARVLTASSGWRAVQVAGAPEAVLVIAAGSSGSLPLRYEMTSALPCVHVVVGIAPGTRLEAHSGNATRLLEASSEGVLAFVDPEVGPHVVRLTLAGVQ